MTFRHCVTHKNSLIISNFGVVEWWLASERGLKNDNEVFI